MKLRCAKCKITYVFLIVMVFSITIPCFAAETSTDIQAASIILTPEESQYIKDNPSVSIAIDTSWIPYAFKKNDGTCGGIIPNIMGMVAKHAGLDVEFVAKDTYADALEAGRTGETTLISGIADDPLMASTNDVFITSPYINIGYSAVTKEHIPDLYASGSDYHVALCTGTYAKIAMQSRMPSYTFVDYRSKQECMDAVQNDQAEIALIANYSAGYFGSSREYSNLKVVQINDFSWDLCFGVNKDADPVLITILNKCIVSLTDNDISQAIYTGAIDASNSSRRLSDIFYNNPGLIVVITTIIAAAIAVIVFTGILRRRRLAELLKEKKYQDNIRQKDMFLNSIPGGIGVFVIQNGKVDIIMLNDSFYRLVEDTRQNRDIWTKNNFFNGFFSEDRHYITEAVASLEQGKDKAEFTCRALKADGNTTWIHLTASVAERTENRITAYCTFASVDIEVTTKAALQESVNIIKAAVNSADMKVWTYDLSTQQIIQVTTSPSLQQFSQTVENVPESLIESGYLHPDYVQKYRSMFEQLKTATAPLQGEFLVSDSDKTNYVWERLILTPIFENNKVVKAIGTSSNINAYKEKESQYDKLVEYMEGNDDPTLIGKGRYNLSKNTKLYHIRKASSSLNLPDHISFDSAIEQLLLTAGNSEESIIMKQTLNRHTLLDEYRRGNRDGSLEYRRVQEKGAAFWSLLKYSLFEEPHSGDIIFFIYAYDITENVREQKMLDKLGATEYDVLGLIDVKTHQFESKSIKGVKSLSDSKKRFVRGIFEDVISHQIIATIDADKRAELEQKLTLDTVIKELEHAEVYSLAFSAVRSNHMPRRKHMNFTYLDESKTTIFYYCTDITDSYLKEQKQLQKTEDALVAARQASASKTEFFSRMSHDMRTPMNGILGMVDLSENETDIQVLKGNMEKIKTSGNYLLGLINDTLDFQKIESGKLVLHPELISVKTLLEGVTSMIRTAAKEKGIHFETVIKDIDMDWYYMVDSLRIEQLFINLLSNAVKFTPAGGKVEFSIKGMHQSGMTIHQIITVSDTGIGMSKDFLEHSIYEPFSQETNIVSAQYAGTGLGLSIVKRLVELMGGTISVESELGVGTSFIVELDFVRIDKKTGAEAVNADVHRKLDAMQLLKGKHILLAEDHPLNAEITTKLLKKAECLATWAKNGQECVEYLTQSEEFCYDLILMDVRMPVLDGIEATKQIRLMTRNDLKDIPIIAVTANAYSDDVKLCLEAGMNDHIAKPIVPLLMYETISKYL